MLMNAKRMSTDLEAAEQYVPDSEQVFFIVVAQIIKLCVCIPNFFGCR